MENLKNIKKKKEIGQFIVEIENNKHNGVQFPVYEAAQKFINRFTFNSLMVCARSHGYNVKFSGMRWFETDDEQIKITNLKNINNEKL